jgi:hypothetical protein
MSRRITIAHTFVEFIPNELDEGTIYVSIEYATVAHMCCCGCGRKVAMPLSPTDWQLTFDGETISLSPSVGIWQLPCRSHYWIDHNSVKWSTVWSDEKVNGGRQKDHLIKQGHYGERRSNDTISEPVEIMQASRPSVWTRLRSTFEIFTRRPR